MELRHLYDLNLLFDRTNMARSSFFTIKIKSNYLINTMLLKN